MRILCTNDDGYLAEGLRVLAESARLIGEVSVVAPDREQSATSHSLTLNDPLRSRRATDGAFVVDGTPTDCVMLGVAELLGSITAPTWVRMSCIPEPWRPRWRQR